MSDNNPTTLHRVELTAFLENASDDAVDRFMTGLTDWVAENGGAFYTSTSVPVDPETGEPFTPAAAAEES